MTIIESISKRFVGKTYSIEYIKKHEFTSGGPVIEQENGVYTRRIIMTLIKDKFTIVITSVKIDKDNHVVFKYKMTPYINSQINKKDFLIWALKIISHVENYYSRKVKFKCMNKIN